MRLLGNHLALYPTAERDVPIAVSLLTGRQRDMIVDLLRFANPSFYQAEKYGLDTTEIPRWLYGYARENGSFRLPRHAPWTMLGMRSPQIVHPTTLPLSWEFVGTLRNYQEPAWEALKQQLAAKQDGILCLSCGKGKTVLACAGFGYVQRPMLAVVTQLFIGEQWKKELLKFTDIAEDRIGMIGDGRAEWNRDVVISTVQTLAQSSFPDEFYRRFGLVFYDEAHRLGARHFAKVAPMFTGVRIGLTATVNRADGMEKLFKLHLGRVFYEDRQQELTPRVYFLNSPVQKSIKGFYWGGHLNMAKLTTHLARDVRRQEFIRDLIWDAFNKNRKTLVLSERIEELDALRALLVSTDLCTSDEVGVCIGALNQEDRATALSKPIILATAQLVKEGLDKPDIDTLILSMPRSSASYCEQAPGRILRRRKGKRTPVVVVINDAGLYYSGSNRPLLKKCQRMATVFRSLGYDIRREPQPR